MNRRGLAVDRASVAAMRRVTAQAEQDLEAQWRALVGVPPRSPRAREALGRPSLAKDAVRRALRNSKVQGKTREALLIRQKLARSSVRKLDALITRTSGDGRLRGSLVYAGAERTGRWSSAGVQLQNLPRGMGARQDLAFAALKEPAAFEMLYGHDLLNTVSEMLRGVFVGPYIVGDWSQIEARALAYLAGEQALVAEFARGEDVYSNMAADIYGAPVQKGDKDLGLGVEKRQVGKVAVLGCGYGLGWKKLAEQMEAMFDVNVEAPTAQHIVSAYRERYPNIPSFWYWLEQLATTAIRQRPEAVLRSSRCPALGAGWLDLGANRCFLFIELPSKRRLYYFNPRITNDGGLTYFGRNLYAGGRWGEVLTYGGKLTENVVQAYSRDVMAHAMLQMADWNPVLTVHDEIVIEPNGAVAEDAVRELMTRRPAWAPGLPLAAEVFTTRRYRK
jgi:DNA polymerase